jgi:hypothetical protein
VAGGLSRAHLPKNARPCPAGRPPARRSAHGRHMTAERASGGPCALFASISGWCGSGAVKRWWKYLARHAGLGRIAAPQRRPITYTGRTGAEQGLFARSPSKTPLVARRWGLFASRGSDVGIPATGGNARNEGRVHDPARSAQNAFFGEGVPRNRGSQGHARSASNAIFSQNGPGPAGMPPDRRFIPQWNKSPDFWAGERGSCIPRHFSGVFSAAHLLPA